MKKNFFKKLSFVLALAMIVSVLAPAAGVFAADELSLNKSERTLLLGQDGKEEFNFNIVGKGKGWKYEWSSSDEDVATVDPSNGVTTAVGVGKAEITVDITDKNGEDVDTLTAKVTVKDNIKEITEIYMQTKDAPAVDKLLTNTEYDFGRKYASYGGSATTAITRWTVDSEKATINDSGVFKATEAGTYTITAVAFQSKAKYAAWDGDLENKLVLASKTLEVTVVAGIVGVAQVDGDTFKVTFDSDMSKTDVESASLLYKIVANTEYTSGTERIKTAKLDATGKVLTVDMYVPLSADADYKYVGAGLSWTFKTAKKDVTSIDHLVFADVNVDVPNPTDMRSSVTAVDAQGIVIFDATELAAKGSLAFEYKGDNTKGAVAGNLVYIYKVGDSAQVNVTFSATILDSATNTYVQISKTASAIATGTKADTSMKKDSLLFAAPIGSDTTAAADLSYAANVTVAAGEVNKIVTKYFNNGNDNAQYATNPQTVFKYETTDTNKLLVYGDYIYPNANAAGSKVVVLVYTTSDNAVIGSFEVSIVAARSFASIVTSNAVARVGNSTVDTAGQDIVFELKDTLGQDIKDAAITIVSTELKAGSQTVNPTVAASKADGKVTFNVKGYTSPESAAVGIYSYEAKIKAFNVEKTVNFTVQVIDATGGLDSVVSYEVALTAASQDIKGVTNAAIGVAVYGLNSSGVKVIKAASSAYTLEVKLNGADPKNAYTKVSIPVVTASSGTKVVTANATGVYTVTVKAANNSLKLHGSNVVTGAYLAAASLEVKDSNSYSANQKSYAVSAVSFGNVTAAVKEAFEIKVNDNESATEAGITAIEYTKGDAAIAPVLVGPASSDSIAAGVSIYVGNVYVTLLDAAGYKFNYVIAVNSAVTMN